jgi:hypothetical protein
VLAATGQVAQTRSADAAAVRQIEVHEPRAELADSGEDLIDPVAQMSTSVEVEVEELRAKR